VRLQKPFYRLPVRFDVQRLQEEVAALPASAWAEHPNGIDGNSSVRLISVDGGENDDVSGVMRVTQHLTQAPYMRQLLASFGVVWSRSRLLRLAPGAEVPEHADISHHWFNRVRLHVPVTTQPDVRFHCGEQTVHMDAGEAWLFDNWRLHRVENPTPFERIHLVADTSGSASFWQFVAQGETGRTAIRELRFDPSRDALPLTERTLPAPVMSPSEVDLLVLDFRAELIVAADAVGADAQTRLGRYYALLDTLRWDWRQLHALHEDPSDGWPELVRLRDSVRSASKAIADGLVMRTNRVAAHTVLEARLLQPMLCSRAPQPATSAGTQCMRGAKRFKEPLFIIAAPRSGSTLLFETLAASDHLCTLGGEAHELVEGIEGLRPGSPRVESNRLTADHVTPPVRDRIIEEVLRGVRDSHGAPPSPDRPIRFLEKTPKNALRIPFLEHIFPEARFILLWRDPRENLSSIMEAWRSGRWKTYNGLEGFDGPWSLLLPPGWQHMNGRPLEEIAAFQWDTTYRIALDDLAALPRHRWMPVSYAQFLSDPLHTARTFCEFAGLDLDAGLSRRVSSPLPLSRYTLTPPDSGKWRRNEREVARVLPTVADTWQRLRELSPPRA